MEFKYEPCEGPAGIVYRPYIPITFTFGKRSVPMGRALIDTGADITILSTEVAKFLHVELDYDRALPIRSAGGGEFLAIPSLQEIEHCIEIAGHRPLRWKGMLYFAPRQPVALLGHIGCLDHLDVLFKGRERLLKIQ
jgi:hypothetical protein